MSKEKLKEFKVKAKVSMVKLFIMLKMIVEKAVVPGLIIMAALNLLGYAYGIPTLMSSVALYFIIEEMKLFILVTKIGGERK